MNHLDPSPISRAKATLKGVVEKEDFEFLVEFLVSTLTFNFIITYYFYHRVVRGYLRRTPSHPWSYLTCSFLTQCSFLGHLRAFHAQ